MKAVANQNLYPIAQQSPSDYQLGHYDILMSNRPNQYDSSYSNQQKRPRTYKKYQTTIQDIEEANNLSAHPLNQLKTQQQNIVKLQQKNNAQNKTLQTLLSQPLKLNNEYLTQRKIKQDDKTKFVFQEYAYKDNWVRLSRGLSNFRITEKMTEKRMPPEKKVKVVKEILPVGEDTSFEGLLNKIKGLTENILDSTLSPRTQQIKQNLLNTALQQQQIEQQKPQVELKGKLKRGGTQHYNKSDNSQTLLDTLNSDNNNLSRREASQNLDQKEIINIHIDTALQAEDDMKNIITNKKLKKRKAQSSFNNRMTPSDSRLNKINRQIIIHKDRVFNNRSQTSTKYQNYQTNKQQNSAGQYSRGGFPVMERLNFILKYQNQHFQKFVPQPKRLNKQSQNYHNGMIQPGVFNINKLSQNTISGGSGLNILRNRLGYNKQQNSNDNGIALNQQFPQRNFTNLDQSVNFLQSKDGKLLESTIQNLGSESMVILDGQNEFSNQNLEYSQQDLYVTRSKESQEFYNQNRQRSIFDQSQENTQIGNNQQIYKNQQSDLTLSQVSHLSSQRQLQIERNQKNTSEFLNNIEIKVHQNKLNRSKQDTLRDSDIADNTKTVSAGRIIQTPEKQKCQYFQKSIVKIKPSNARSNLKSTTTNNKLNNTNPTINSNKYQSLEIKQQLAANLRNLRSTRENTGFINHP
eukprot:403357258